MELMFNSAILVDEKRRFEEEKAQICLVRLASLDAVFIRPILYIAIDGYFDTWEMKMIKYLQIRGLFLND